MDGGEQEVLAEASKDVLEDVLAGTSKDINNDGY